jgi:predicted AlkP superfamily pyrophosphatase or phosphodiesterase
MERGRVRNYLSKIVKKALGYQGYFQLYNAPLKHIHLFDYCEKKDLFKPGGFNQGQGIFDVLHERGISFHVSNWRRPDQENLEAAMREVGKDDIRFAFIYLSELDGLLHALGTTHPKIGEKIQWYEKKIRELYEAAGGKDQVMFHVFSDHGQADVHTTIDLMSTIDKLGFIFGKDYVAFYDSTIARFWFFNEQAEKSIRRLLHETPGGKVLVEQELEALGAYWPDGRFGELMFLVDPGIMIVPSHMGKKPMAAMHGYLPADPSADGIFLANVDLDQKPGHLKDLFPLMASRAF